MHACTPSAWLLDIIEVSLVSPWLHSPCMCICLLAWTTVNFKWAPNISWKLHFHVWSHPQIHFCLLRVWMATPRNWSTCGNFWTQYMTADCKGKLSASQTVWLMVVKHHAWTISSFTAKTAHELSVNLSPCLDSYFRWQTLLFIMCSLCAMNQLCAACQFPKNSTTVYICTLGHNLLHCLIWYVLESYFLQ